jgi:hypothetical protein
VEEQPVWTTLDSDAEQVVKRPEVLHGEFPLKSGNSATQKLRADAVKMISSTYSKRYTVSEPRRKMNNEVSDLATMNPSVVR